MSLSGGAPDLASLELLVVTARCGSLSRAAAECGLAQPSASARIRRLERRLGLELLERGPTGSRPTLAGRLVVEWAVMVLEAVAGLQSGAAALRQQSRGRLRLAASYTVAEYLLPRWLVSFHRLRPDVAVSVEMANSANVAQRVGARLIDLGFVESHEPPPGLGSEVVASDELAVIVGPAHPWARRRRPLAAAALGQAELVAREPGSGTRESFEAALRAAMVPGDGAGFHPSIELGSTSAIKAAVLDGLGPAVLSRLAVAGELASGALVEVEVVGVDLSRRLRAVWAGPGAPPEPTATFLASLRQRGEQGGGAGP
ncbi:MAG: LysR substrate-binding domain-containing protein [Acidimicrobiales bacterium]